MVVELWASSWTYGFIAGVGRWDGALEFFGSEALRGVLVEEDGRDGEAC